ncbi:hypothetical protein AB0I28_33915 [Phytomonospora sp. NPDC050363]|uniref:hypothetical protein n=1 Tax=Phytomonospora sp. NPDC050363 TaxID=3155642 RepID=UPI0033CBB319
MTSPFPPPPPSQWGPDGTGEPRRHDDDPPASGPTSYELYPAEGGGWPDQPVTGAPAPHAPPPVYAPQPYGPPPPQAYGPPPPHAYQPAPYAPPQYMPGPPIKSGGNKGWIIGGITVGAVVILCVVGIIVIGAIASSEDEPIAYSPTVPAAASHGSHDLPNDLCGIIDDTRYETTFGMEQDSSPTNSSSPSGSNDGDGWASCYFNMNTDSSGYDWAMLSVDLTVDSTDYLDSAYDSAVGMLPSGSYSGPSLGEESQWGDDHGTYGGEALEVAVRDGNAVVRVSLNSSQDNITKDAIANLIVDTVNEVLNATG